jgi:hypothetical protein
MIDRCAFEIDDCWEMVIFYSNLDSFFSQYVANFMNLRIEAMKTGNGGEEKYWKMILNSAYGKDFTNSEMFEKIVFKNKQNTLND